MSFADQIERMDGNVLTHLNSGEVITFTDEFGANVSVLGLFDKAFESVQAGEAGVISVTPAVFVLLKDLPFDPEIERGSKRVTVDGVEFHFQSVEKDGKGGAHLLLHRVDDNGS